MSDLSFADGAGKFINQLVEKCGDDLIYSLAYEDGNWFLCVTAHNTLTEKEFNNGNIRVLFQIAQEEMGLSQDEMVNDLARMVNEMIVSEDNDILNTGTLQ